MGGQTEGHVERGLRGKEIIRQAHGQTDRQMDKHKDRQTDRQTDRCTNKQTDRLILD